MGISSLDSALTGLRVSQQQIALISNNVANVGTEGYTRKIMPQTTQVVNGITVGVLGQNIIRTVDISLERDLWTQISATSSYEVREKYLERIESFHGAPDAEISIAAELGRLRDSLSLLSDSPDDEFLQASTVNQAVDMANKINDLSRLITTLRNDAQNEIDTTVGTINGLLNEIASYNNQIETDVRLGRSTAQTEDQRSLAIKNLSGMIGITYFKRGDGVITVQTTRGLELVSDTVKQLSFTPEPLTPLTNYPSGAAGVYIGDPATNNLAIDITDDDVGGKLGGLLKLRDETFPKQMAQIDEFAHKMAYRFGLQGLSLFTDAAGSIPEDTAPTPNPPGPLTPVEYVGFSAQIRVNQAILDDNSLIQQGTYGATLDSSDNQVIRRVLDFGFSNTHYQRAVGDIDLSAATGTLQDFLGIRSQNTLTTSVDLADYASISALLAAQPNAFGPDDNLVLTFDDPDIGTGPYTIALDLSTIAVGGVSAAQDLVDAITADADWANIVTDFAASVTINSSGQLVFQSRGDIQIAPAVANGITDIGLAFLGMAEGTYEATDPYFNIQVGKNDPVRIVIEPADDEADLLAKLQAVPGLAVQDFTAVTADGFLRLRPGNDFDLPEFGGDLKITSGPFKAIAANAAANTIIGAGTIVNNINLVSALFGSFSGSPAQDETPISDVAYSAFRTNNLGTEVNVETEIAGATGLIDYAQKTVNEQTQELILVQNGKKEEDSLRSLLDEKLLNQSGVNLDEELGNLIVMQNAYAAAARVINAIDELFTELMNALG